MAFPEATFRRRQDSREDERRMNLGRIVPGLRGRSAVSLYFFKQRLTLFGPADGLENGLDAVYQSKTGSLCRY